jgi:hypothetical protein
VIALVERIREPKVATPDHRHFRTVRPTHVPALRLTAQFLPRLRPDDLLVGETVADRLSRENLGEPLPGVVSEAFRATD